MPLKVQQTGTQREPVPAGNYFAVCIGVYDIGTQPSGNPQYPDRAQVVLQFELHKKKGVCRDKEGRALLMSAFMAQSFGKSNSGVKSKLRQCVEGITGKTFSDEEAKEGYPLDELVGVGCRIKVAHETTDGGGTRDFIETFMPLDEDDPEIEPESNALVYDMVDAAKPAPIPDGVPEWIEKKIKASAEWLAAYGKADAPAQRKQAAGQKAGKASKPAAADDDGDDIPF